MSGVIKSLMIGIFILIGVSMFSMNFFVNANNVYGIPSNSSVISNKTATYITNMTLTSTFYQDQISSENIDFGELSLIGLIFRGFGTFITNLFQLSELLTMVIGDFVGSSALFNIPPEFMTILVSIIGVIIVTAGIALLVGRSPDDL